MNNKIKSGSIFFLVAVLVAGTISLIIPSSFAEPEYYSYEEAYAKDPYIMEDPYPEQDLYMKPYDDRMLYPKDPYANDKPHHTSVNVQKLGCLNSNINVNGVNINQIPENGATSTDTQQLEGDATNGNTNGNGWLDGGINIDRNLVNICANINLNGQIDGGFLGGFLG